MSNKILRAYATKKLAEALGNYDKAVIYMSAIDSEVKAQQEIAADVIQMID